MIIRNWIELALLVLTVVVGVVSRVKTKRKLSDIDGFGGIHKKSENGGHKMIGRD